MRQSSPPPFFFPAFGSQVTFSRARGATFFPAFLFQRGAEWDDGAGRGDRQGVNSRALLSPPTHPPNTHATTPLEQQCSASPPSTHTHTSDAPAGRRGAWGWVGGD